MEGMPYYSLLLEPEEIIIICAHYENIGRGTRRENCGFTLLLKVGLAKEHSTDSMKISAVMKGSSLITTECLVHHSRSFLEISVGIIITIYIPYNRCGSH